MAYEMLFASCSLMKEPIQGPIENRANGRSVVRKPRAKKVWEFQAGKRVEQNNANDRV